MKLRSLDTDSSKITLGQALRLICVHLECQSTSTKSRIDFWDSKNRRSFSVEGREAEIEILHTLYLLIGPKTPLEMIGAIPDELTQLKFRRSNPVAYHQGIVHTLGNLYHIKLPDSNGLNVGSFNQWLRKFELL